jgi:hypothetical protein
MYEVGDRVKLSPEGRQAVPRSRRERGVVVGIPSEERVRVQWDELSTPRVIATKYVLRDEPSGRIKEPSADSPA